MHQTLFGQPNQGGLKPVQASSKHKGSTIFAQAIDKSRLAKRRNNKIEPNRVVVLKTGKIYVPNGIWTTQLGWVEVPPSF